MAIGTSKIGVLGGGGIPAGTETFNASGTFSAPVGLSKVTIVGKGGTGNAGNPGNTGNAGNGGSGGGGGFTVEYAYCPCCGYVPGGVAPGGPAGNG